MQDLISAPTTMKSYEELTQEALKLRLTPEQAPGKCSSCRAWQVARTQVDSTAIEMQCGQSRNMGYGLHGQDGKAIITPAEFGCALYAPRLNVKVRDRSGSGTSLPPCSAAEWWARHAALLSEKMAISGVKSFRIDHEEGKKYTFEVTPMSDEPNDTLCREAGKKDA